MNEKHQKEKISIILDLKPNTNTTIAQQQQQNGRDAVLLNLTGTQSSAFDPTGMTKDQFLELNNIDNIRKRNWSTSSGDSSEFVKPLYGNKEIIYHELEANDTLQNLALTYNCNVSILSFLF